MTREGIHVEKSELVSVLLEGVFYGKFHRRMISREKYTERSCMGTQVSPC